MWRKQASCSRAGVEVGHRRFTEVLDHWLEAKFRRRRWMRIPDATACVRAELRKFVQGIERVAVRSARAR